MNKTVSDSHTQTGYVLDRKQRVVLGATAIVMIVMLLFPPFHLMNEGHEIMAMGYHFGLAFENASVDREMLRIELVTTFLVGAIGTLLFHSRKPEKSAPAQN